jgi:uncharacterized membrane protein
MLQATFWLAVLFAMLWALPSVCTAVVLMLALPALIAGVVYFRANARAFCMGCLATYSAYGLVSNLFSDLFDADNLAHELAQPEFDVDSETRWVFVVLVGSILVSGIVGIVIRRLACRQNEAAKDGNST